MGGIRRWAPISVACAAMVLAACARDATAPAAETPRFASQAVPGAYLVGFGGGIPDGFAARVEALGGTVAYTHAGAGIAQVSGLSQSSAGLLAKLPGVTDVVPDATISLRAPLARTVALAPGDAVSSVANPTTAARYGWQWNMRAIGAQQAWAAGKLGSSDVTVAIIDTGIDYDAPDLNGLVDLSRSKSFVLSDDSISSTYFASRNAVSDYNGHGTNVATQVSSKAYALAGVTSKTKLMAVKVLSGKGNGNLTTTLKGVLWAADHGADVANLSLGGGFAKTASGWYVGLINQVFTYAARRGMLVVVSAGNENTDLDHDGNELQTYCGVPTVLCVSSVGPALATGSANAFSYFSNYGRSAIGVAAPGGNADAANNFTASTWPWGSDIASWVWSYCSKTRLVYGDNGALFLTSCAAGNRITGMIGTSQAAPHVAGLAALLIAERGRGQPALIKALIQQSSDDLGRPGVDPYYGRGRINVARALGL